MLHLKDIAYTIGEFRLFSGIDWHLQPGRRVALIGPNGAGKTTLLRIIHGDLPPETGTIIKPKDYRIGYLPQEEIALGRGALLTEVLEGNPEIIDLEREIFRIHRALEEQPEQQPELLEQLGKLESRYQVLDGYRLETEAKKILSGLGFREQDFHRAIQEFSGGWRMRAYLARLLLQRPDLLLLDEPTNHLDLPSLEWLEAYLRNFAGSIIMVSHDRFFIDRLAQEIAELERGRLTVYPGDYHFYEAQKKLNEAQLRQKWEALQKEKARQQQFIDRFRYKATKASQVQSRVKQLEKMEEIELPPSARQINFSIQVDQPSYKEVLKIEDMSFRYTQDWVLESVNFELFRGDKVALVGPNGVGKTTLTRLITGQLSPRRGAVHLGNRVSIGYYAQHQIDQLNLENSIYREVLESAADSHRTNIRNILGLFRFSGDDTEKKIGVLSGGEKARVSLAKILLSPVNFLIMDEPTNHLDLFSKQALEEALQDYDGTLLLISHDRYFLDKLVRRVAELKDGALIEYLGNYSEYLEKREADRRETAENSTADAGTKPSRKSKMQKQLAAEARQAVSRERNELDSAIKALEREIHQLEAQKNAIEEAMGNPELYKDGEKAAAIRKEFAAVNEALEERYARWEKKQLMYEALLTSLEKKIQSLE